MAEVFPDNGFGYGDYYDYPNPKKKKKMMDTDQDGLDDRWEMEQGIHDRNNRHIKHIPIGTSVRSTKGGIIIFEHEHLKSFKPKMNGGKMKLNIKSPKKMKLDLDIKSPVVKAQIKKVAIPKFSMDDSKIKTPKGLLHDEKILTIKKKKFGGFFGLL